MALAEAASRPCRTAGFLVGLTALWLAGACSEAPMATEAIPEEPLDPMVAAGSWTLDVFPDARVTTVSPPLLDQQWIQGTEVGGIRPESGNGENGPSPGNPLLSIVGQDVVSIEVVPGSVEFGPINARSMRRRVAMNVVVKNRLSTIGLSGSTHFPLPPEGVTTPVIFPVQSVAMVFDGSVSTSGNQISVEMPSKGEVIPSDSIWMGPPHDFFFQRRCGHTSSRCFPFQTLWEVSTLGDTIRGGRRSAPIRLGWDVDATVTQFRTRLVLAADLLDSPGG